MDLQLPHLRQLDMRLSHLPFKSACPLHVLLIIHVALFALQPFPVVFASVLSPVSYLDMQFLRLDIEQHRCCKLLCTLFGSR